MNGSIATTAGMKFDLLQELFNSLRRYNKIQGERRAFVSKEKFLSLRSEFPDSDSYKNFFDGAERDGVQFCLYDNIACLCGTAGLRYVNKDGVQYECVYIIS